MHSTCFLQSSCACASCPLPFPSIAPSHSTCCGCRVGLSTPEAFHASNGVIAHTHMHTHTHTHTFASSKLPSHLLPSCLCRGESESVFWVFVWPELSYKVVSVLMVFRRLKFRCSVMHYHAARGDGYFPASW